MIVKLEKNQVHVLQDEVELIADKFYIIGRQDKSEEYAEKKSHNGRTDGKP